MFHSIEVWDDYGGTHDVSEVRSCKNFTTGTGGNVFFPCFMMMHALRLSFHTGNEAQNLPACLPGPVHTVLMNAHCYSTNLTRQYNAKLAVQAALFCVPHKTGQCGLTVTVPLFCLPHKTTHMKNSQLVLLCVVCPTRQHIRKTVTYSYFVLLTWQESTCAELSPVDSVDTKQVYILLQGRD